MQFSPDPLCPTCNHSLEHHTSTCGCDIILTEALVRGPNNETTRDILFCQCSMRIVDLFKLRKLQQAHERQQQLEEQYPGYYEFWLGSY